mmetsp:Transcript_6452/g.15684  ORF Transcript_6452/g.15684 Transcript_6452/m.15684 type:complete len:132 (-) Transcript_6452:28-423(-)
MRQVPEVPEVSMLGCFPKLVLQHWAGLQSTVRSCNPSANNHSQPAKLELCGRSNHRIPSGFANWELAAHATCACLPESRHSKLLLRTANPNNLLRSIHPKMPWSVAHLKSEPTSTATSQRACFMGGLHTSP